MPYMPQDKIEMKRHITMWNAVFIIIGSVIGSGIFIAPKGVTENVNSVGASLIIWAVTGFINLGQALCYAELGGLIPVAGGDYAYLYYILGPLPAFLVAWLHIFVISASGCAVIARTAALYLIQPLGLGCRTEIITLLAAILIVTLAMVNAVSALWGKRVHILFTIAKTFALLGLIIIGIVLLSTGHTKNFENAFGNTTTDPGNIGLSVLDGYFAYKGWELVNALPEEMVNPTKDIQPAVVIGMLVVTAIYVLTNAAYFSILSPAEVISSDAVAITFSSAVYQYLGYVMPVFVALSCMGAVNGDFLANSRYLFAGGRFKQVPQVLSFIHIRFFTPFLSVIVLGLLALTYCLITNLQVLQEYSSLAVILKTVLALVALFYYRWKEPDLYRPYKVNTFVAMLTLLITLCIVGLSFYQNPRTIGIGVAIFLLGVPLYYLGVCCRNSTSMNRVMECQVVAAERRNRVIMANIYTLREAGGNDNNSSGSSLPLPVSPKSVDRDTVTVP
ncbi:hypothetical protein LSH36_352g03045 [Paralvinella palmiformis]|uniref:Amino acid transporter n=1 Tax=Paralvinella palmiformis TaxID=53620 RepID=A0AAD9JFH6_9ANNE|nr:hypothetical protein LSH36_352g03045 [Paralvinella palmiformis]